MFWAGTKPILQSAAWRISAWAALAYACGTLAVFAALHGYVAGDIERRNDAWLAGEVEVLGDVAERTPRNALYERVVEEVAELASREVPNRQPDAHAPQDAVFFLDTASGDAQPIWVGPGKAAPFVEALGRMHDPDDHPFTLVLGEFPVPFRVVATRLADGSTLYLGLSERDQLRVLRHFRMRFALMWALLVLLGTAIVFLISRRMLNRVRGIMETASRIDQSELSARVPTSGRKDEIGQLARTFNHMLDRIQASMQQLHTITGSLAHDLRSPLTAIRGNLEVALTAVGEHDRQNALILCMEELDRLTNFLNTSLDVAEARADALLLNREPVDLDAMLRAMAELYEPSLSEHALKLDVFSSGQASIEGDLGLLHRMLANLFSNEIAHLQPGSQICIQLRRVDRGLELTIEDDGPGFPAPVLARVFGQRIKGAASRGHGLGLAFVEAVARAHGAQFELANKTPRGAILRIQFPVA